MCSKALAEPAPDKPFPFPYEENFESYSPGATPKYFSDQKGTFEVYDEPGHGKCLRQIVPQQGRMWDYMRKIIKPYTVIGDQAWTDYALSADVRIDGGDVELGARFKDQKLAEATDESANHGMAILASTYNGNLFDNVRISRP